MYKFRVLQGTHHEINPKGAPNIKDSMGNERFAENRHNAFIAGQIFESDKPLDEIFVNKFERVIDGVPLVIQVTDARRQAVQELIQKGSWGEDDRKFLEELSEDGWTRIARHSTLRPEETRKINSILGEDVTDSFQRAYDEGFRVFKNVAGKHQVTRGDHSKPLNKVPLEANRVEAFIEQILKEK